MIESCVILGDCKSNGQNTIAWKTCNDYNITVEFSLQYGNITQPVIEWYLKERSRGVYTEPISMKYIQNIAFKKYKLYERQFAWPNYLNFNKVYNLSTTGTTYQGYIADIKNHLEQNKKPTCVCITDITDDHIYIRVNDNGVKHNSPVFQSFLNSEYNPELIPYSLNIYNKRQQYARKEIAAGQDYLNRKNAHSFYLLTKLLDNHNIPYFFLKFREDAFSSKLFEKKPTLDLSAIHRVCVSDNGDHSLTLYSFQKTIAEIVQEYIEKNIA